MFERELIESFIFNLLSEPLLLLCCCFGGVAVEREVVQKRTFTRWINLHLEKVGMTH